jgi:hypothetical protein
MADTDAPSFKLAATITDPNLVAWLEEIPEEHLGARVQDTLRAGHFVLNLVQAAAGEEQMSRYFRPVTDQMERLEDTLEEIMGRARASQQIGKIGERFAVSQLTEAFPGDRFEDVSGESHEADIRAYFDVGDEQPVEARIEVKFYSDDVPTAELDKFRRDLKSTGVRFGLMVSMASRLTGMRTLLKVEEEEGSLAVFVSRAGLDGVRLIAAAAMLKAIILYHARAGAAHRLTAAAIRQAWARLSAEIQELQDIARQVADFRTTVRAVAGDVSHRLNELADRASDADIRLRLAVQRLTGRLRDELDALPSDDQPPALPAPTPPDAVLAELDRLGKAKDKRAPVFRGLHELAEAHGLDIHLADDGSWMIARSGREIARTAGTKSRLDVAFPVGDTLTEIDPTIEEMKNQEITISGKDPAAMLARVEARLRGQGSEGTA